MSTLIVCVPSPRKATQRKVAESIGKVLGAPVVEPEEVAPIR